MKMKNIHHILISLHEKGAFEVVCGVETVVLFYMKHFTKVLQLNE